MQDLKVASPRGCKDVKVRYIKRTDLMAFGSIIWMFLTLCSCDDRTSDLKNEPKLANKIIELALILKFAYLRQTRAEKCLSAVGDCFKVPWFFCCFMIRPALTTLSKVMQEASSLWKLNIGTLVRLSACQRLREADGNLLQLGVLTSTSPRIRSSFHAP